MECSKPPALTDEALSAVLDNEVDDATQQHLMQCPGCAAQLEGMRHMDTFLKRLRRVECPPPQRLADYHLGFLDAHIADEVHQHLAHCPRCQAELVVLKEFLSLPEEAPVINPIIELWPGESKWKAKHVETSGSLALKGMKGADDETPHDAKAGTATIYLESNAIPTGFVLKGQVIDNEVDWVGAIAEIWRDNAPRQIKILDEMAEFRFEFRAAGSVDLCITAVSGVILTVENVIIQP